VKNPLLIEIFFIIQSIANALDNKAEFATA